jgi:hypothetical protein
MEWLLLSQGQFPGEGAAVSCSQPTLTAAGGWGHQLVKGIWTGHQQHLQHSASSCVSPSNRQKSHPAWNRNLQQNPWDSKSNRPSGLGTPTSTCTHTFVTLGTHPAFHASFVAILVTGIVSKEVVSGPTKLIAAKAIVVVITGHTDLILKVGNPCVLLQCLPLPAGVYHARVRGLFNNTVRFWRHKKS